MNMPEGSWSLSMLRFSDVCWSDLIIEDLLYFRVRARGDGKLKKSANTPDRRPCCTVPEHARMNGDTDRSERSAVMSAALIPHSVSRDHVRGSLVTVLVLLLSHSAERGRLWSERENHAPLPSRSLTKQGGFSPQGCTFRETSEHRVWRRCPVEG